MLGRHGIAKAYPDVAALFEAVAAAGPDAPHFGEAPGRRGSQYVTVLKGLADSLTRLDPQAAHALFARRLFTAEERLLAGVLAAQVKQLEVSQPELKRQPVPAPAAKPR